MIIKQEVGFVNTAVKTDKSPHGPPRADKGGQGPTKARQKAAIQDNFNPYRREKRGAIMKAQTKIA